MSILAGVDIGGSGTRTALVDGARRSVADLPGPMPSPSEPDFADRLVDHLRHALADVAGSDRRLDALGVGIAGLPGLIPEPEHVVDHLAQQLNCSRVVLAGDAVAAHLGALGGADGTVVAAGTGVIALATDHEQVWKQADGWGALLGDTGGGGWIGQEAVRAALRAHDGREDGSSRLLELLSRDYGPPHDILRAAYSAASPASFFAGLTPQVELAAHDGDSIALGIWAEAGAAVAQSAVAASRSLPGECRIAWSGGLFGVGDLLLDPFREAVTSARPEATLVAPLAPPLEGALHLARRGRDGGMTSRPPYVHVAG